MRTSANCAAFVDKATYRKDIPEQFELDEKGRQVQSEFASIRDGFFLLSVMNQFTINVAFNGASAEKLLKVALFSRQLRLPAAEGDIEIVRQALARDTREARKRGTVQCFLSMGWFLFGMVISIQQAFGLLGQDGAAHDLALGLAMIWFPVLMLCTVVDRNPAVPEATQRQLNVFLALVRQALLRDVGQYNESHSMKLKSRVSSFDTAVTGSPVKVAALTSVTSAATSLRTIDEKEPQNWFSSSECKAADDLRWIGSITDPALDEADFFMEFAGQGRKLWHYGVAHPIVQGLKDDGIMNPKRGWLYEPDARANLIHIANPERKDRIHSYDLREFWQISMAIFAIWGSCISAFIISYFTPTIGLGCRALGYTVFVVNCTGQLLIEMVIWYFTPHHKFNTPAYKRTRLYGLWFLRFAEFANAAWLMYFVFAQALGSYNTCKCKCSNYGLGGGYMDWIAELNPSTSEAKPFWIAGTAMGCAIMAICFAFIAWEWVTQSHLSSESYGQAMKGLRTTRRFKTITRFCLPFQA